MKNVFKDNDVDGKNKQENEIINQQIFNLNFNSKNIEPFSNFSLIKNSIENEKFDQIYQNKKEKFSPSKKTNHLNNNEGNGKKKGGCCGGGKGKNQKVEQTASEEAE